MGSPLIWFEHGQGFDPKERPLIGEGKDESDSPHGSCIRITLSWN